MRSEKSSNVQKRSFIEEARRAQIIEAAIEVLNEVGYAKASLAKIATKAGISTSLTLYHFKDKQALMSEVAMGLENGWTVYIEEKLQNTTSVSERLKVFIEANLAYMGTRPKYFAALMELYFNARDIGAGREYDDAGQDPSLKYLKELLEAGQKSGDFKEFDPTMMAVLIRGVIDQFLGYNAMHYKFNLENYTDQVIAIVEQVVIKEGK